MFQNHVSAGLPGDPIGVVEQQSGDPSADRSQPNDCDLGIRHGDSTIPCQPAL
jgi:hypothetical protein